MNDNMKQRLRAIVPALLGLAVFIAIASAVMYSSQGLLQTQQCDELAAILCLLALTLGAVALATIGEVVAAWLWLRRFKVPHPIAIPALSSATTFVLYGVIYAFVPLLMNVFMVVSVLLFVGSFVFYDWLLNRTKGQAISKILVSIAALVLICMAGFAVRDSGGQVYKTQHASDIRQLLQDSQVKVLVPPAQSTLPQPYSIASENGTNYNDGVYLGLDGGEGAGLTIYEYKYTGPADPTKDCQHLYAGATEASECSLQKNMPSGLKIYSGNYLVGQYFVIKDGTIVFITGSDQSDDELFKILDQLQPAQADTLLQTLHDKNPSEY